MSIERIITDDLRLMRGKEGLVLQGCGGDLQEWLDGINSLFTEEKLLLGGTRFEKIYAFEHDGLTNLLFPFSGEVKLNMGKLVMWRLQTHENFGGTWLSDYVPNRLQVPGLPDVPGIRRLWLFPHRPGPQGVWPIHQGQ